MTIAVLLLGAGASSRMRGGDKLLEPVGGVPLLRLLAERALAAGARVVVTLPPEAPARAAALEGLDVEILTVPDAAEGMSASLRRGAAALADVEAMIVLPADMPEIDTDDILNLINPFRADPSAPLLRGGGEDGTPGHPVLFPRRLLPEFAGLTGDAGAAAILKRQAPGPGIVPLPERHALTDLDSPEDWQTWREGR